MCARESGKGVLIAPFPLLKTNRLGVILTFAVYKMDLPSNATPNERIKATLGYVLFRESFFTSQLIGPKNLIFDSPEVNEEFLTPYLGCGSGTLVEYLTLNLL